MTHAERINQKLKSGRICFSPKLVIWFKCKQIQHLLMEYKLGCNKNQGNLKQAACIQKIKHLFQISMAQLKIHLEICEEWNNYFQKYGAQYHNKHLLKRAGLAKEEGREEVAAKSWPS
jgi:hypothetical protein